MQISMEDWTNHFAQELGGAKQKVEGARKEEEEEEKDATFYTMYPCSRHILNTCTVRM